MVCKYFVAGITAVLLGSLVSGCSIKTGYTGSGFFVSGDEAGLKNGDFMPEIDAVTPGRSTPGSEIKISGKFKVPGGYPAAAAVEIDNGRIPVLSSDSSVIKVKLPLYLRAGELKVVVVNAGGRSAPASLYVAPVQPASLRLASITFSDEKRDNKLAAEESGKISMSIENKTGAGPAFGIKAYFSCYPDSDITFPAELVVGDIPAGEKSTVELPLSGGADLKNGTVTFSVNFSEKNNSEPAPSKVSFQTKKTEAPDFQVSGVQIDDCVYPGDSNKLSVGNNNGIIEPGESIEVKVAIVNKGAGVSKKGVVSAKSGVQNVSILQDYSASLDSMLPGAERMFKFAFRLEKKYVGSDRLPIELVISDARPRFNKTIPLGLRLGKTYAKTQEVIVKGETGGVAGPAAGTGDDLTEIPKYATGDRPNACAVVIGIENYRDIVKSDYAAADAKSFKDYLVKGMGFREENIKLALDERASRNDLVKYFDVWLKNRVEKDSPVIVYYSGHGSPDPVSGETYLVPYDGDQNSIKYSGYSLKELYSTLKELPTRKVLVVLDSCFSGAGGPRTVLAKGTRPLVRLVEEDSGNLVVLAATDKSQIAGGYEEKQHGIFTYFFLKGLQGGADTKNSGRIYLGDLYDYLKPQVSRYARTRNIEQDPVLKTGAARLGEWADFPLAITR